jgi:hypothetical protein
MNPSAAPLTSNYEQDTVFYFPEALNVFGVNWRDRLTLRVSLKFGDQSVIFWSHSAANYTLAP